MARKTIASLEAQLEEEAQERLAEVRAWQQRAEGFSQEAGNAERKLAAVDPEAIAISGCIAAIDRMAASRTGLGSVTNYVSANRVERVLRFLADRYGVPWHTPPKLPVPPYGPQDAYGGCDGTAGLPPMEKGFPHAC